MEILLDSATATNVDRFLSETRLSESSPPESQYKRLSPDLQEPPPPLESEYNFASSCQLGLQIHGENSVQSPDADANNNTYKKMLRYVPNTSFCGEAEQGWRARVVSVDGASVPNTFKHKSHQNAKTKRQIGLQPVAEVSDDSGALNGDQISKMSSPGLPQSLKILNLLDQQHTPTENSHTTPSWMPQGLEDKWEDLSEKHHGNNRSDSGKNVLPRPRSLDFLTSSSNTFVHNPQNSGGAAPATPMWKKMSKEYQSNCVPSHESPLKNIFQTMDNTHDMKMRQNLKTGHSAFVLMSTVSTPVATRDSDLHLTQQQIHQLEDMLEKAKDQPDDYQIKGSPLKLFGNEYDTFTKAILSKFVDKVRSNANSIQRQAAAQAAPLPKLQHEAKPIPVPKLRIKSFTKLGDYTDQDFMQNANNIFAHLQQKGYKGEPLPDVPENMLPPQKSSFFSRTQTTATSTPKPQRKQNDIDIRRDSLHTYLFSSGSDTFSHEVFPNTTEGPGEYTEIDKTHLAGSHMAVSEDHQEDLDDHASYTFDELSDLESRSTVHYTAHSTKNSTEQSSTMKASSKITGRHRRLESPSPRLEGVDDEETLPFFESSVSSVKQFMRNPSAFKERDSSAASAKFIKWKGASQLRLLSDFSNRANSASDNSARLAKGTVKPGQFPGQYGDMVFDSERSRWVSRDQENPHGTSLDSIEDLVSDTGGAQRRFLNFKKGGARSKMQLEVSFQVPRSENTTNLEDHMQDVTSVSEADNVTFSQSNKELVSLITGSTDKIVWETITSINLSDKNIDRVENLEQYLPAVKSIDLSKNRLKFVEGLPPSLFELDVTKNNLSDMTSFHKFHDLQVVNASYNSFRSFSCLTRNVNLTKINLMGNQIDSLEGFPAIHALKSMNLSRNNIAGKVHLYKLNLPNLKELNLSENAISLIDGVESLENLRILNVNENRITALKCAATHKRLKKLLCKFNDLKKLRLESFPYLRVLRIDGNSLESLTGLKKLDYLQELSAKSQGSPEIVETLADAAADIASVDFSGNTSLMQLLPKSSVEAFYNVNQLNLSAVGLTMLPENFGDRFFNVRELNLSFNKLVDLKGLANLKQLKKVQILSNNLSKMEDILTGLQKFRQTLRVLDMRLNIINFEFYPYVFSPQELELARENKGKPTAESPIPIQSLEDIESFTIHYNSLSKSPEEWRARDHDFLTQMRTEGKDRRLKERLDYETILAGFFVNLKELDGGMVPREKRTTALFGSRVVLQI